MKNDEKKNLKFVLYVRKSTEDDNKQVQSIEDQTKYMSSLSEDQDLRIIKTFKESRSAKKPHNRPEFAKMLEMIESGKANAILCWEFNRLSRNPTDTGHLQQLLQDGKIKLIQTYSRMYLPDDNALLLSVEGGMANQMILDLMKNVRRGLNSKATKGWKPGLAPIGYKNDRDEKDIKPDIDRFDTVRKLWDLMLTGTYSVADITKMAKEDYGLTSIKRKKIGGKPLSYTGVLSMFRNPFYKGHFNFNGVQQGRHIAMVTEEEWDKVQAIIDPKHTLRPKGKTYDFMFRGLLRCGDCGFAIVTVQKEKHQQNGNKHTYRYCHCSGRRKDYQCSQKSVFVREEEYHKQIKQFLTEHTIDPEFYQLAIEALAEMNDGEVAQQQAIADQQKRSIAKTEESINELARMRYRGLITDDDFYVSEKEKLEDELVSLRKARGKAERQSTDWRKLADQTFTFARYAKEDYDTGNMDAKRAVILKLGQNLTVLDGEIQFDSVKYLVPIAKAYPSIKSQLDLVRTSPQQIKKDSEESLITQWCG